MANVELVTIRNPKTNITKKVEKRLVKDYTLAGWVVVEKTQNNYVKYSYNK